VRAQKKSTPIDFRANSVRISYEFLDRYVPFKWGIKEKPLRLRGLQRFVMVEAKILGLKRHT
jgi:hypothetical protein